MQTKGGQKGLQYNPPTFIMHASISYHFTHIVKMNTVKICKKYMYGVIQKSYPSQ